MAEFFNAPEPRAMRQNRPGETLGDVARFFAVFNGHDAKAAVDAAVEANDHRIEAEVELGPGQPFLIPFHLLLPTTPEPEPEPAPEPAPEPEQPAQQPSTDRRWLDTHVLRTGSLSVKDGAAKLDQIERFLGRPVMSWSHIGGAWDPFSKKGAPSPITRLDMWDTRRSPFVFMIERAVAADRRPDEIVIEFTLPLGLRGPVSSPSNNRDADPEVRARSMDRVRQQLTDVADGRHVWGWSNAESANRPYIGEVGNDQIHTYCDAVATFLDAMADRYGSAPQVTCRGPWEFWGFTVFPWSPAGLVHYRTLAEVGPGQPRIHKVATADDIRLASGVQITDEMDAIYHVDDAIDPFVAAYRTQAAVLDQYGIPLSFCGDKRGLDVMLDGDYAGRNILDVLVDELGDTLTSTGGGQRGPTCLGPDLYVSEANITRASFDARYRPVLDHSLWHARRLGIPMALGEVGYGSGREDEATVEGGDTIGPLLHLADWLDEHADDIALVSWFVPGKGGHDLRKATHPERRRFLFDRYGTVAGNWGQALYANETTTTGDGR